jgi:proline iminopeptidase
MIAIMPRPQRGFFVWRESMQAINGYIRIEEGVRLYYNKIGSGPAIVIPNGFYFFDEFQRFAKAHTMIFYDVRNRGCSDSISEPASLKGGIVQDVEDLGAVRKHFQLETFDLVGHSYIGLLLALYGKRYPESIHRMVLIDATQPDAGKEYSPPYINTDGVMAEVFSRLRELQRSEDPIEACKQFWKVLRRIYVFFEEDAPKVNWGRCDLANERNFMKYWTEHIFPSIQKIHLTADDLASIKSPVLILHGDQDRSAPYGGGRDWSKLLPNARLLTLKNVAHAPWLEAPQVFFDAVETFLGGNWPAAAEKL